MSRTKIVATIGPATASAEALTALKTAGMNMARLNGSHADLDWHAATIGLIRATLPDLPILLDIPGRKIRTIQLAHEPEFAAGATLVLTTDTDHDGREKVPVNYANLHADVQVGQAILADDGTLRFTVIEVSGRDIVCRAESAGRLKSRKGINVPNVRLNTALVTERDHRMVAFARELGVDFIGISFVESAEHVQAIRTLAGGASPRILAKIENQGGLDHMDEVLAAADAVMIDRGDLSVETNVESVAVFQKLILAAARRHGKPVVVATEMLHSMIVNNFPTKAEITDITNAVLDGCAATMLSGETAVGAFPIEAVATMRRIADVAEDHLQRVLDHDAPARDGGASPARPSVPQAMEDAVALVCRSLPITKIVVATISGYAARMVAARQPRQPILAVSPDPATARALNLLAGTEGLHVDVRFSRTSTDHIVTCLQHLWRAGRLTGDDLILVTAVGYPRSGTRMNLIQTHYVRDLVETLGWTMEPGRP